MSVFLRGPRVDVLAPDAADEGFERARQAWLLPTGALPAAPEDEGDVAAVWAPAGGATQGSLAWAHVDWVARRAQLVATRAPDATPALAEEALALWLRYARDELGLERLEARVRADDAATRALLARHGFREEGQLAGAWHEAEPVDVALMARKESLSPREKLPP